MKPMKSQRLRALRGVVALTLGCMVALGAQATPELAAKYYEDALGRYQRKDLAGAKIQLKNAINQDRKMLAAHMLLGRVLLATGELQGAEVAFKEALAQGVNLAEVAPDLGQVYLQLNEPKTLLDTITLTGMPQSMHAEVLVLRGTAFAMSGNMASASAAFAQARQLDPKAAAPLIAEATLMLRAGDRDGARKAAQKATELAPDNSMAWYQLGIAQQSQGDKKGALASYDKTLALSPKFVDAHISRAAVLLSLGRQEDAAKALWQLKEWGVVEPRASFLRATILARRGDTKAAAAEYNESASFIDAMSPDVRSGSEPLLLTAAEAHLAVGNVQKAREYLETLIARNGRHYAGQMLLAGILLDAKETSRAAPLVENLMRATPDEPQVLLMMGNVHMQRRQYAQAAELFDRASKGGTSSDALRELAFSQFGLGQDKLALATLEKAYAKNPRDYRAGMQLAVTYARQGQGAKAVQVAEALVKLDPANTAMINFLGNVKGRLSDKKGMRETFQRALAQDPKFRPAIINLTWLDLEEGRLDDARARLQAFLTIKDDDPDVLYQLGLVELQARRPDVAMALWTRAENGPYKDARPGLAMVDLLLSQRQTEKALPIAKALAARYPGLAVVQISLARAHRAAGDLPAARSSLLEATKLAGFDVDALVQIGRLQLAAGNPDGATHAAAKALQAKPDDLGALLLQAETAGKRGDAKAVDIAMAALNAKHAGKVPVLLTSGHVAFSRRQLPQAIGFYRTAFEREPGSPIALLLTQAYVANNQPDKALALLVGWTGKNPKDLVALRALAEVQSLAGKGDAAKQTYAAVVAAAPDDPSALGAYAQLLQRLGDPAALAMAEKAMKLAPSQAAYADAYGWMLVGKGDLEGGIRILREARLREPGNGVYHWHLAIALSKAGRKSEARDELRAALATTNPPPTGPELSALKVEVGL